MGRGEGRRIEVSQANGHPGDSTCDGQQKEYRNRQRQVPADRAEQTTPIKQWAREHQKNGTQDCASAARMDVRHFARAYSTSLEGTVMAASGSPVAARTTMASGDASASNPRNWHRDDRGRHDEAVARVSDVFGSRQRGFGDDGGARRSGAIGSLTGATRVKRSPSGLGARNSASGPMIRPTGSVDGRPVQAMGRASGP